MSPILFVMGMGIVTRTAERERPFVSGQGCTQFSTTNQRLEDLTVTTTTHIQAKWVLLVNRLVKMPIQGEEIPSIVGIPI